MNKKIILGLDVSTHCIGITVAEYDGDDVKLIDVTHLMPKVSTKIKGVESLFLKNDIFYKKISDYKDYGITDVVIEEPLVGSNNINTVATLLRFNGMVSLSCYNIFGVVPYFISSYDARKFAFPELMSVRVFGKSGEQYPTKKIIKSLKDNNLTLFGSYPFDCDKKHILWNKVSELYPEISWIYNKDGELKKENFDASDSLVCVLGYVNKLKYGDTEAFVSSYRETDTHIYYDVNFCGKSITNSVLKS